MGIYVTPKEVYVATFWNEYERSAWESWPVEQLLPTDKSSIFRPPGCVHTRE